MIDVPAIEWFSLWEDPTYTIGQLRPEYLRRYAEATINANRLLQVNTALDRGLVNRVIYEKLSVVSAIPWFVILALHMREGGNRLDRSIKDGHTIDPSTFFVDATKVLRSRALPDRWDSAGCLFMSETYNGFGPRHHGINTGYLWSFTDEYTMGKYNIDGHWDPTLVDEQPGVVTLFMVMVTRGLIIL